MTYRAWGSTIPVTAAPEAANGTITGIGLDRFVYVWQDAAQDAGDTSGIAVRMKVYDPFGVPLTTTLLVNTTTVGNQARPQVLGLANGGFVVAWEDNSGSGADTSGTAIRGQVFDVHGNRVGTEFLANTAVAGNQSAPVLARNGDGFVVAWVDGSAGHDDIRAQRFDAAGAKVGGEIVAGASSAGNQSSVAVADTASGFALAWDSDDDANGTVDGVHVQVYTSAGATRGAENTITTATGDLRLGTSARVDAAGHFVVEYHQRMPAPSMETETRGRFFDSNVQEVADRTFRQTYVMLGAYHFGNAIAPWATATSEPAAQAGAFADGMIGSWSLSVGDLVVGGTADGGTIRSAERSYSTVPTVLDATMLLDGRIVIATRESSGALAFNIADGRGPNFGAASIHGAGVVLVGADAGEDRHNVMTGTNSADTMYGLGGNDYLYGYAGNDLLIGGFGSDVLLGAAGNDTLYGEGDDDYLYGESGTNVLVGGAGVDVVYSQGSNDTSYGGDGDDYLYCYGDGVTLALGEAGNDIFIAPANPSATIYRPEPRQVRAYGGDGNDYFYMGSGSDFMSGGAGVDVLQGGKGDDTYDGGAGTDYLFLGNEGYSQKIDINAQSGVDVVHNFNILHDIVRLQGTALTSYAQLLAATTDYGSFSVITIDANTAIWLVGVAPSQFTPNNFQFS